MAADTADIRIGKGIVSFSETDESAFRDLGFVPNFDITEDITEKDYISAREGVGTVAKTFLTRAKSSVKFTLNSINTGNVGYFALAEFDEDTTGNAMMISLSKTKIEGYLKCEGTNDDGRKVDWIAKVGLRPSGTFSLITDGENFSQIDMVATVIKTDKYGYGKYTVHAVEP